MLTYVMPAWLTGATVATLFVLQRIHAYLSDRLFDRPMADLEARDLDWKPEEETWLSAARTPCSWCARREGLTGRTEARMPIVDPWLPYRLYFRHSLLHAVPGAALTIAAFLVGPVAATIAATLLLVLLLCAAVFGLKERRRLDAEDLEIRADGATGCRGCPTR